MKPTPLLLTLGGTGSLLAAARWSGDRNVILAGAPSRAKIDAGDLASDLNSAHNSIYKVIIQLTKLIQFRKIQFFRRLIVLLTGVGGLSVLAALSGRCAAVDLDLYPVGKWSLGADASSGVEALAVVGDHVLLAAGSEGLVIVNVQDPANPRQVGRYLPRIKDGNIFVDGHVYGVWISGSHAFVGVGDSGLHVLDIREPANPKELAILHYLSSAFDNLVNDVAVLGNLACVATRYAGLIMVNIADPTQPRQVGTYNPDQVTVSSAAFLGDHLFVAVRQELSDTTDFQRNQLRVLDLTDPVRPREVGPPRRGVFDVAVAGTLVFLASQPEEYSDPESFPLPLSKRVSLEVMEFSDPVSPKRLGSVPVGWYAQWGAGGGYKLAVAGRHACVGVDYHIGSHGLVVIDVSNPAQPRTVGTHYGGFNRMATDASHCYVPRGRQFQITSLVTPGTPPRLGDYTEDGFSVNDVKVVDRLAYMAGGRWDDQAKLNKAALVILDVSSPSMPQRVGSCDLDGWAISLAVSGGRAYLATGGASLQVVDVTDPANPKHLGTYHGTDISMVALAGDYAFVAEDPQRTATTFRPGALRVLDLNDPTNPRLVGGVEVKEGISQIAFSGHHACLSTRLEGLLVIDVSEPRAPRPVGRYAIAGWETHDLVVAQNLVYVSGLRWEDENRTIPRDRLVILDIADPSNPRRVGGSDTFPGERLALSGSYLYSASSPYRLGQQGDDSGGGVHVVDVSNPANPRRVGGSSSPVKIGITIAADRVFAVGWPENLVVLDLFRETSVRLEPLPGFAQGAFRFRIMGPTGLGVRVQRSSGLSVWQDWQTATLGDSPVELTDSGAADRTSHFYRVVYP